MKLNFSLAADLASTTYCAIGFCNQSSNILTILNISALGVMGHGPQLADDREAKCSIPGLRELFQMHRCRTRTDLSFTPKVDVLHGSEAPHR